MEDLQALAYFSPLSHISRKIAHQEKSLIKYLGNKWTEYSPEQKDELLNDLCVPHFIRDEQPAADDEEDDDDCLPSSWPTLKLPSGQKIVVDETDIWTWQDEHSGPFSWKSKSQQDLTLLEFEPENLTKPQSKRNHKSSESDPQPRSSPPPPCKQFVSNHASWTAAVLADYFANCIEEVQTPVHTPSTNLSPAHTPAEEVNPAFEGSTEDLSSSSPAHSTTPPPQDANGAVTANLDVKDAPQDSQNYAAKAKTKGHVKTPSPKKLPQPSLAKRDKADSSRDLLILDNRDEEASNNAFTNPALEVEWSNFVGQSSTDSDDDDKKTANRVEKSGSSTHTSAKSQNVDKTNVAVKSQSAVSMGAPANTQNTRTEPASMVMDRGGGGNEGRYDVHVSGGGSGGLVISGGEDSVESTPDHTTQLLKKTTSTSQSSSAAASATLASRAAVAKVEEEKEEVVYVMDDGDGSVSVSSKLVTSTSADDGDNSLRSGFDFLDNW